MSIKIKDNTMIDFSDNIKDVCHNKFKIVYENDICDLSDEELLELKYKVSMEIQDDSSMEQSLKLLGNSMYGGCSHVAFYWFNLDLANDITGESRTLTMMMEKHIDDYLLNEFPNMLHIHKELGVEVDQDIFSQYQKENRKFIVYGDTDSVYTEYGSILRSFVGYNTMTTNDKLYFIINFAQGYLNNHNKSVIDKYYLDRHAKSIHDFELETVAFSGIWLDAKKKYAQALLWKDGREFSTPKIKTKGLETIKGSYPKYSRVGLNNMITKLLLEDTQEPGFIQNFNFEVGKIKAGMYNQQIDDISSGQGVNGYGKYVVSDNEKEPHPIYESKASAGVKAIANYNFLINKHKFDNEYIRGGKIKIYKTKSNGDGVFGYIGGDYPDWAYKLAPIDYDAMFQSTFLDPLNRVMDAANLPNINGDGSLELSLF